MSVEKPTIVTPNSADRENELKKFTEISEANLKQGAEKIEGEIDKDEVELHKVDLVNSYIKEIFDEIGLPYTSIPQERIHLLPGKVFNEKFPDNTGQFGFSTSELGAVYVNLNPEVNKDISVPLRNFSTELHESIHFQARTKLLPNHDGSDVASYRSGYRLSTPSADSFVGFNEGVVALLERRSLINHKDEIASLLEVSPEEVEGMARHSYEDFVNLVTELILKISELRGEDSRTTYLRVIGEQFTGNMMHLRDIEKLYGKHSLRLLSRLGSEGDGVLDGLILDFFETETELEREKVLKEIEMHDGETKEKDPS